MLMASIAVRTGASNVNTDDRVPTAYPMVVRTEIADPVPAGLLHASVVALCHEVVEHTACLRYTEGVGAMLPKVRSVVPPKFRPVIVTDVLPDDAAFEVPSVKD